MSQSPDPKTVGPSHPAADTDPRSQSFHYGEPGTPHPQGKFDGYPEDAKDPQNKRRALRNNWGKHVNHAGNPID